MAPGSQTRWVAFGDPHPAIIEVVRQNSLGVTNAPKAAGKAGPPPKKTAVTHPGPTHSYRYVGPPRMKT